MKLHTLIASSPWLLVLTLTGVAFADVPPPEDYVETCTVARQQKVGETCVACSVSMSDPTVCSTQYEPQGYALRCRTSGASVFSELYCRATDPSTQTATQTSTDSNASEDGDGCAVKTPLGGHGGAWAFVAALSLGLGFTHARRRARRAVTRPRP